MEITTVAQSASDEPAGQARRFFHGFHGFNPAISAAIARRRNSGGAAFSLSQFSTFRRDVFSASAKATWDILSRTRAVFSSAALGGVISCIFDPSVLALGVGRSAFADRPTRLEEPHFPDPNFDRDGQDFEVQSSGEPKPSFHGCLLARVAERYCPVSIVYHQYSGDTTNKCWISKDFGSLRRAFLVIGLGMISRDDIEPGAIVRLSCGSVKMAVEALRVDDHGEHVADVMFYVERVGIERDTVALRDLVWPRNKDDDA